MAVAQSEELEADLPASVAMRASPRRSWAERPIHVKQTRNCGQKMETAEARKCVCPPPCYLAKSKLKAEKGKADVAEVAALGLF